MNIHVFFIVCPMVFLAGIVDSIAGGGGLISLPAYLMAGLPPHMAVATNKLSSSCGTTVSAFRYLKNRCVSLPLVPSTVLAALAGSAIGARLVLARDERYIKGMLFIVLPVTAFFVLRKKSPLDTQGPALPLKKQLVIATLAAFIIGAYDGFYGPGTGTFLVLILTGLARMDVRTASGNTKCINLASNVAALVTFLINGQVFLLLGLCAALFSILGNFIGSGMVVKNGAKTVRPIIIVVLILLFFKLLTDF